MKNKNTPSNRSLQKETRRWLQALATRVLPHQLRTAVIRLLRIGRRALKMRSGRVQLSILTSIRRATNAARRIILFFPKTYMKCLDLFSKINAFEMCCRSLRNGAAPAHLPFKRAAV